MNLLVITPRYYEKSGGDGLYSFNLVKSLLIKKIEINVLTIIDNHFVHIYYKKEKNDNKYLEIKDFLYKVDSNLIGINFYSRFAKKSLEYIFSKIKPDIIHIHGIHQYFTVSSLKIIKKYSIPAILTVHDFKILCGNAGFFSNRTNSPCLKCLKGKFLPPILERCKRGSFIASLGISIQMGIWKYLKALNYIDCFHCGSTFVFELLKKNNELKDKLKKITFPILYNKNYKIKKIHTNKKTNIVFIGRLVPHKGISIFADSVKNITSIQIDIFGDGPLYYKIRNLLENKNVTFHGWKSREEIDNFLSFGTIVVAPYLALETFCYVIVESMMKGCCVIASDRGAIPELIKNEHNGIIIRNPTSEKFKNMINYLLSDKNKLYSICKNALYISNKLMNLSLHAQEIKNLYENIITERKQ